MKRSGKTAGEESVIALALTWDGARWPVRTLPPKARAFLTGRLRIAAAPSAVEMGKLFARDEVREIRVCWVPRLKGGNAVLSEPFLMPKGGRITFKATPGTRFGDILGVIYRRGHGLSSGFEAA